MLDAADMEAVKPIVAILAAGEPLLAAAHREIEALWGAIDLRSEAAIWHASDFYEAEMGADLLRQFVSLATLAEAACLAGRKHQAGSIEHRYRDERGGRRLNLDPGYVGIDQLVLASTKQARHRIAIGRGVFAEATLGFVDGSFVPWPYTYPDYCEAPAIAYFNRVRARLKQQRRGRDR